MKYETIAPAEPNGPLWDMAGTKWTKSPDGRWAADETYPLVRGQSFRWYTLLEIVEKLFDTPEESSDTTNTQIAVPTTSVRDIIYTYRREQAHPDIPKTLGTKIEALEEWLDTHQQNEWQSEED